MDFTLVYRGPLPAATSGNPRAREKQAIRRVLDAQLRQAWLELPGLAQFTRINKGELVKGRLEATPRDQNHSYLEVGEFRIVPLVQRKIRVACDIHLTLLRRESPGAVVHGGDLDNRLKTLLDAFRMPQSLAELGSDHAAEQEHPFFYCLLEDDSLITSLSVETHQLFLPIADAAGQHDVDLLIRVRLRPSAPTLAALAYL